MECLSLSKACICLSSRIGSKFAISEALPSDNILASRTPRSKPSVWPDRPTTGLRTFRLYSPSFARNQSVIRATFAKQDGVNAGYDPKGSPAKRPPHFTVYQPQLTWIASIANRGIGGALGARQTVLYGFSIAYLVAPGTFDSVHVAEFVAGLPDAAKYAGKALLAAPLSFTASTRSVTWPGI
ncbi:hypothetical protein C8R46DRAFT_1038493 [Mycena filopes]|nr:hypothetical protein C8R46DRAFT_1038493 [Mycena filopes]